MLEEAIKHPDVQFCHATGTKTTVNQGVKNFHNAFATIYEGRFLAGYAAGLKLYEENVAAPDKDPADFDPCMVGYVGAFPYAEVKSGYTSWYLGLQEALRRNSVDADKVTMKVQFTGSWYDPDAEHSAAENLINQGAVLISQHADSMGAPTACELAGIPNVTYNIETGDECEETYLAYSRINWAPYYEAVVEAVYNGTSIEGELAQNWAGSLSTGSVEYNINWANLTSDEARLEEYQEQVATLEHEIVYGDIQIFDCSKFTVSGEKAGLTTDDEGHVTSYLADVEDDGTYTGETEVIIHSTDRTYFAESFFRSAPYFDLDIDGIVL